MAYDARQIANWFIARAKRDERTLSIMSLLKLAYIAHGWRLEITKKPLFTNKIEAWRYGPVIPDVYNEFRKQGVSVSKPARLPGQSEISERDESILEQVWDVYGDMSAFKLSALTHIDGGPWDIASKAGGWYANIPDDLIRQHYELKRVKAEKAVSSEHA